jgi:transcriptional regulator with PAS, ATPase and Fis domain
VLATLRAKHFDHAYLLYNYPENEVAPYLESVRPTVRTEIHASQVTLRSPVDFGDIYQASNALLKDVFGRHSTDTPCILLSPGTPAMQAIWILLGKTRYPAVFFQSSVQQGVEQVAIPFDISAEFLPELSARSARQAGNLIAANVPIDAAFDDILTDDPMMQGLIAQANVMAAREVPVLIHGETGTGKELFATAIHNASPRRSQPLVPVNCGAIPRDLIDATLFGHVKGAFTGATTAKLGYFEAADGGTLFLDELGELPLDAQVRLLRVLQTGDFYAVGGNVAKQVDVRVIAATNRDLLAAISAGRFREDLFYRIAVGVLNLPPLRERPRDIPLLADALIAKINQDAAGQPGFIQKKLSIKARNLIKQHPWPGNVRELYATLLRASLWSASEHIDAPELEASLFLGARKNQDILNRTVNESFSIQSVIDEVIQHYTIRALDQTDGNRSKAAALLGLGSYQTLNNWIKKHGVET